MSSTARAFSSPTFLFYTVFVVTVVLTVLLAYILDTEQSIPQGTYNYGTTASFPNAYPQITPTPVTDPTQTACLQLCSDEVGALTPCTDVAIQTCTSDSDCSTCIAPYQLPLSCQSPDSTIAKQQAALGNTADKYCLLTKETCANSTDPLDLKSCTRDIDCAVCDDLDDSTLGESMVCQYVTDNATLSTVTKTGEGSKTIYNVPEGNYCLPKLKQCDYTTGSAVWTELGWVCKCNKYGDLFGGSDCTKMQACNNDLVTSWSQDKQQLLINVGDDKGKVWDPKTSLVDPFMCHDSSGNQVSCDTADADPNVVCQCDGVSAGDFRTFTYNELDNFKCDLDPCFANAFGGRTVPHALSGIPLFMLLWNDATTDLNYTVFYTAHLDHNGVADGYGTLGMHLQKPDNTSAVRFGWQYGRQEAESANDNRLMVFVQDGYHWQYRGVVTEMTLNDHYGLYVAQINQGANSYQNARMESMGSIGNDVEMVYLWLNDQVLVSNASSGYLMYGGKSKGYWAMLDANATSGNLITPYNQPVTNCVCSGRGASLWDFDQNAIGNGSNGYSWVGRCESENIPQSTLQLPADGAQHSSCQFPANVDSSKTMLVPGGGDGEPSTCMVDPCRGNYSDPYYSNPNFVGHFDSGLGFCNCGVDYNLQKYPDFEEWNNYIFPTGTCDRGVNPVCSLCVNACQYDSNACPPYWSSAACASSCRTNNADQTYCVCDPNDPDCSSINDNKYCVDKLTTYKQECNSIYPLTTMVDQNNVCDGNYMCKYGVHNDGNYQDGSKNMSNICTDA